MKSSTGKGQLVLEYRESAVYEVSGSTGETYLKKMRPNGHSYSFCGQMAIPILFVAGRPFL